MASAEWSKLAVAECTQASRNDPLPLEVFLDVSGPLLTQHEIVGHRAALVAVSFDGHIVVGIGLQALEVVGQRLLLVEAKTVLVEVEVDTLELTRLTR